MRIPIIVFAGSRQLPFLAADYEKVFASIIIAPFFIYFSLRIAWSEIHVVNPRAVS